ncbi:response regulator [Cohnella thailandensis]|uniref:Response regulator n=1 Tax=Cohnella thailandensis TaxID=557557 RepID=A0A841SSE1_9BACL|nr:response regulator [Cohnella thailandensis]MBB6634854.1 response regulator [Cohnella thailandensis]MBP1975924.1 CheY-like chemotaxis protein [Cohnella thailandensis]
MNKLPEAAKLNELMYQAVVERYWAGDEASVQDCGIVLVRCLENFEDTIRELIRGLEAELHTTIETVAEPGKRQAAFLLFGSGMGLTHYAALHVKGALARLGAEDCAMMLAGMGKQAERNPRYFETMTDMFEQLPESMEIVLFRERYQPSGTQSVLLVDGDEETRRYVRLRLSLKGYRVLDAEDGNEGLELFRREKPDVIVTDLNLTGMDGYHMLTRILNEDAEALARTVVFTDNRVEETMRKCYELGVADYVTKPFSPAELEQRIERLL